jgi:hypothetical protein
MFGLALPAILLASAFLQLPSPSARQHGTSHDFGRVRQGETVTHEFHVTPPAPVPARILRVDLTGPGMSARFKPAVPAGHPAIIRVLWNTARLEGAVEAQAIVRWTNPALQPVILNVAGTVVPAIELQPMAAAFFSVFSDERADQAIQIVNHDGRPLAIERIEPAGSHFLASIRTVEAGRRYELRLTAPAGQAPGRFRESVILHTDSPQRPVIRVPVNVLVKTDVYANPERLDFGDITVEALRRNPALLKLTTQTILIKRRQGPFELTASTDIPGLTLTVSTGNRATHRLDVSIAPDRVVPGRLEGTITLRTTDPRFPQLLIPVRARIR